MSDNTRRTFIKRASLGAAAAGAVVALPSLTDAASAAPAEKAHPLDSGATHDGAFTVWVKDASSGELAVLVGEQELVYHDPAMARRLSALAAKAQRQS